MLKAILKGSFSLLLFVSICYAQDFTGGFTDFGPNRANSIYTDTSKFTDDDGVLGASDVTVQIALQTLNASGSTVESILNCDITDSFCFQFSDSVLALWVGGEKMAQWPITSTADNMLLETGDIALLETGDRILLE